MQQNKWTSNTRDWLNSNAFGIIIAGSNTTITTLIVIFYYLVQFPGEVKKLRVELDTIPNLNPGSLQSLFHLNGVTNEALRLYPPVPSGGLRKTPPEGITISGTFIPGDTTIVVPLYCLHRREY